MVQSGFLSEPSLIWFLTHHEIGQSLQSTGYDIKQKMQHSSDLFSLLSVHRSKLLRKAMRRKQLFPAWDKQQFPEIISGNPIQIEKKLQLATASRSDSSLSRRVAGTPACPGLVTGPARVVTHISEADTIQPGEILVTTSTDIGWSPHFPVLAGVVTELGGLISHGAVVAREYGLPCLVGVTGATRTFSTGDIVRLDAVRGDISLVTEE